LSYYPLLENRTPQTDLLSLTGKLGASSLHFRAVGKILQSAPVIEGAMSAARRLLQDDEAFGGVGMSRFG
jgi:hypothetical protein